MAADPRIRLLQFADGLFPAGGYAHSFGLETYVQDGRVHDAAGLEALLRAHLAGSAGPCDARAVVKAVRLARDGDVAGAVALDHEIDALRPAFELREASRQMGRQTLRVAAALVASRRLLEFAAHVEARRTPGHHPVVFGLVGGSLGWPEIEAAQAFLQANAAAMVSAALRLMPLGQLDGQRVLWAVGELVERLANEATADGEIWSFAPALEIAAMRHPRLDARLFRS